MQRALDVSVIIRTFSEARWDNLVAAVGSVRLQTCRPREVIVVVDHNPRLLERVNRVLGDVVSVASSGPRGASSAMNSGIAAAQGAILAFLDDDATAAPDWLEYLTAPYIDERVLGVGGRIEPVWPHTGRRPAWLPEEFQWVVGCTFPGGFDTGGPVTRLIGANMSFRRQVFEQTSGFRAEIGAVGASLQKCEDTEFCLRVARRWPHHVLLYEPRAVVYHHVPAARIRWQYFCARCYAEGQAKAQIARLAGARQGLALERRYALRTLPRGIVRHLWIDVIGRRDPAGLLRIGAILVGLSLTGAGYAAGIVAQDLSRLGSTRQLAAGLHRWLPAIPGGARCAF